MKEKETISKRKQSIIAGALISSAGMFFAKFIGLLYAVPFNGMLQTTENIAYFGVTSQIFGYLLSVCQAGFPFAVATLVARYTSRGDYKTSLLIRKLASRLMLVLGAFMMILLIAFSKPLATILLPNDGNNVETFQKALILTSFALVCVPVLSSMRGFYQGLKKMDIYALSQVLEQLVHVAFLLVGSAIAIYIFNSDRVWAVYFGVLATSVAAILAMIHLKFYDRSKMKEIKKLAKEQSAEAIDDHKELYRELFFVAMPFMLIAVLGYSDTIINTMFLNKGLQAHGLKNSEVILISSAINFGVLKLMSIPMVLAPGFSSAIIPHVTSAIAVNDFKLVRKNIRDCVDIVLYIALPISFCLFVFAKPIYSVMFPPDNPANLELYTTILKWFAIVAFLNTMSPILTNLLMAVGLRRVSIRNMGIQAAIKIGSSYFLLKAFGFQGIVISTVIAMGISLGLGFYDLTKRYHVKWKYTFHKLIIMVLGCAVLWIVAQLCFKLGLKGYGTGRIQGLFELGIAGLLSVGAYFAVTYIFQIPQTLLHLDFSKIVKKLKRG